MNETRQGHYYFSNDLFDLSEYVLLDREGTIFVGIANPHCFHAIPLDIQIEKIHLMDINQSQVDHLNFMIECIKSSDNRMGFVKKFLGIDFPEGLDPSKQNIWENSTWTGDPIGEMTRRGIIYNVPDSFGGITEHRLTLFEDDVDPSCFYLGYGKGWLKSEDTFAKAQALCEKITVSCCSVVDFYNEHWDSFRYHQVILWFSNLLSPWFISSLPEIASFWDKLCSHLDPKAPREEMDVKVIFDKRSHVPVDARFIKGRQESPHFKAFREVVSELGETNIEVPGVDRWMEEDEGVSKLPNTQYVSKTDFELCTEHVDTVFLHGLMSHEKNRRKAKKDFAKALDLARTISDKVIVLEFDKGTSDVIDGYGTDEAEMEKMVGAPKRVKKCGGDGPGTRNLLYVY
jgi:hypothetical protein